MNWLDIVLLLFILISVVTGFMKGFVRLGIGFAAVLIGFLLGVWFYGLAGNWLVPYVHSRAIANLLGFTLVFVAVILLGGLVSLILARTLRLVGLGALDRIGGAMLGGVRGVLMCSVVVMALLAFMRRPPDAVVHSKFAPYLAGSARMLSRMAPYEVREGMRHAYDELRRLWGEVVTRPHRNTRTEEI